MVELSRGSSYLGHNYDLSRVIFVNDVPSTVVCIVTINSIKSFMNPDISGF